MEKPQGVSQSGITTAPLGLCPLTGSLIFGKRIAPHSCELSRCKNGALFAKCNLHNIRFFYSDRKIVEELTGEPYAPKENR